MQVIVNRALRAVEVAKKEHATYMASIAALRKGLSKKREIGRARLLPMVAKFYGVAVVDGQGKATGSLVMDSESASYEAAKTALRRMLDDIYGGGGDGKAEPVRVTRAQRQAAKSFLAQFDSLSAAIAALKAVAV
jgi:hypothetical protein